VGPTHNEHAPPFAWSRAGPLADAVQHIGQPDEFAYEFERMSADASRWWWVSGEVEGADDDGEVAEQ